MHHGALGGYAIVYIGTSDSVSDAAACCAALSGIEAVLPRAEAADAWELPPDRIGAFSVRCTCMMTIIWVRC